MAHLENVRGRSATESGDSRLKMGLQLLQSRLEQWLPLFITAAAVAIWQWQVQQGGLSALLFPAPSDIIKTFMRLAANGELTSNLAATLQRVLLGFCLGSFPALILGLLMGWSRRLHTLVDPFVGALHPIPKIAILPLFMVIFGIGEAPKVILVAVAVFFPMLINTVSGVKQISPIHFEVAQNYGATTTRVLWRVVLPGALPLVLTGVRLALNIALLITIAVEVIAAHQGLGKMVWFAWQTMRTEELYVSLAVTALLGIGINSGLYRLERYLVPWQAGYNNS